MEYSTPTLFPKRGDGSSTASLSPRRKKKKKWYGPPYVIPAIFAPITVPLLLIAALISIPVARSQRRKRRRAEQRFAEEMEKAGRTMAWSDFQIAIENNQGTRLCETLGPKSPWRIWWTNEDISAISPNPVPDTRDPWPEEKFDPFYRWCQEQFTSPSSGRARLVIVPPTELKNLQGKLAAAQSYAVCSWFVPRQERFRAGA